MALPVSEPERLCECLAGMVEEHRRLLDLIQRHELAMRKMDTAEVESLAREQEQSRTRVIQAEARRRLICAALSRTLKIPPDATLSRLAVSLPAYRVRLLAARDELKSLAKEIQHRSTVAGRIASAMLGHLNTAVRLLAGAVERGGVYTKTGTPKLTRRIGSMSVVG